MTDDNTYPDDELMEAYFDGLLRAEERAALEKRMADDPEVAQKVALHRKVVQTIRFARKQRLREQFRTHFDAMDRRAVPESGQYDWAFPKGATLRRWATVVVMLLLYGAIAFFTGEMVGRNKAAQTPENSGHNNVKKSPQNNVLDTLKRQR